MDLTSNYRSFFEQPNYRSLAQLGQFGLGVYRAGKWQELVSYLRWEVKHRLGLFPTNQYVRFTEQNPLVLNTPSDIAVVFTINSSACVHRATQPWRMLLSGPGQEQWGCLFTDNFGLYSSPDGGQPATLRYRFTHPIQSFFTSAAGHLYVCAHGQLLRSINRGESFQNVLSFSSPESYFLTNNGMTELLDGRLLIGEYGVVRQQHAWQNLAYIYYSTDQGATWKTSDFLIRDGVNKHVHLVKYSTYLDALLLTDGDNKKQIWLNRSLSRLDEAADNNGNGWLRLNRSHYETGGYLSMAESDSTVLLGSDYLGGTNFLVSTTDGKRFRKQIIPDPYRRSPIMNMVTRRTKTGQAEIWAVLHNSIATSTRCLLMFSADAGRTWTRVIDYDGTQHEIKLVSSSPKLVDQLHFAIITKKGNEFSQVVYSVSDN